MISNAQPWDNLKFSLEGVKEVQRKFFGTLYNTYSFLSLYANIDGFKNEENTQNFWFISKNKEEPRISRCNFIYI